MARLTPGHFAFAAIELCNHFAHITETRNPCFREAQMKNVTISMDDELHRSTRIETAKAGKSMSRYISDKLRQGDNDQPSADEIESRKRRLEALRKVFNGPKWDVTENGRMPSAEERNARR